MSDDDTNEPLYRLTAFKPDSYDRRRGEYYPAAFVREEFPSLDAVVAKITELKAIDDGPSWDEFDVVQITRAAYDESFEITVNTCHAANLEVAVVRERWRVETAERARVEREAQVQRDEEEQEKRDRRDYERLRKKFQG